MSRWAFDLGNSRLKLARFDGDGRLDRVMAVAHDGAHFGGDWQSTLPPSLEQAWIASVGPLVLRQQLAEALAARGAKVGFARTLPCFAGISIAYAQPQRLGVDRMLAMAAARARDPAPALVVGIGTALTIDLVDAEGRHRGGRIAPSPSLMREALQQRAPQLPVHGGTYAEFGDDTESALASGCSGAAIGLIERSRQQARQLMGAEPRLWLHGGGVDSLPVELESAMHAPTLVLEGLLLWALDASGADTPLLG